MRGRLALIALVCLALSGCVVGQRLITSRGDYRTYRTTVVGATEVERLAAGNHYLKHYPSGRYIDEVRAWFAEHDARYVARNRDRASALRDYLKRIPDGPRSTEVRARLTELEIHRSYSKRDSDREAAELARVATELGAAMRTRREFVQVFALLVSKLSRVGSFGLPISALNAELRGEFRATKAGGCEAQRCFKQFKLGYAVPGRSEFIAREAQIELLVAAPAGRTARAELAGPELFSRVGEAVDRRAVAADSLSGRVDAVARAAQVVENALEARMPAAECEREAVAPAVLVRDCRGLRVEMRAGTEPPFRDTVVVTPSRLPPMP
jgi:hypothetical protein